MEHLKAPLTQGMRQLEERMEERNDRRYHELAGVFRGELIAAVTAQTKTPGFTLVGVLLSFGILLIGGLRLA